MKKLLFSLLLLSSVLAAQAQTDTLAWFTDLPTAESYAAEHQVKILMVFAGSDWCKPCIQLKHDILLTEDFAKYADRKLAVLYLDFPSRRKNKLSEAETAHNETLAEKYNRGGAFPKMVLLDPAENILAEPEFKGQSVSEFVEQLNPMLFVK